MLKRFGLCLLPLPAPALNPKMVLFMLVSSLHILLSSLYKNDNTFLGYILQMLMIISENSFFHIFFFIFCWFCPKNTFGDENISFFSFGTFLTLCQIKILRN